MNLPQMQCFFGRQLRTALIQFDKNEIAPADLHFRLHWFRWLIEQAPDFDLVCIAGDLLDLFKFETRTGAIS
jgi:hypothetical protein